MTKLYYYTTTHNMSAKLMVRLPNNLLLSVPREKKTFEEFLDEVKTFYHNHIREVGKNDVMFFTRRSSDKLVLNFETLKAGQSNQYVVHIVSREKAFMMVLDNVMTSYRENVHIRNQDTAGNVELFSDAMVIYETLFRPDESAKQVEVENEVINEEYIMQYYDKLDAFEKLLMAMHPLVREVEPSWQELLEAFGELYQAFHLCDWRQK